MEKNSRFTGIKSEGSAALIIALAFVSSRILFYLLGGRFIAKPVNFAMQYLDPQLLQHDLIESLYYLHAQPPLFNLFIGSVLKISAIPALTYGVLFQTAGLIAFLCFYGLLCGVHVGSRISIIITILCMLNPTVMLYENLLYYTYFESVLIIIAAFCFFKWCSAVCLRWAIGFWVVLGLLGGIRSVFHPAFFILLLVSAGCLMKGKNFRRRHVALFCAAALFAILPLGCLVVKNYQLYGFLGSSSWDGMNLWTKACGYGPDELERLHSRGIISSLALQADLEPFRSLEQYQGAEKLLGTACHHPADCQIYKSTGKTNFNHAGYVALSRQLRADSVAIILHDPGRFAFQTLAAYSLTLWHASDSVHSLFHDNMEILAPLEKVYRYVYFGFLGVQDRFSDPRLWMRTAFITLMYLIVYAAAIVRIFRAGGKSESAIALLLFFCVFIHAYMLAVSSLIEFGENNRFRFPVDGVFIILAAAGGRSLVDRFRKATAPD